jgi:hypothetical protein
MKRRIFRTSALRRYNDSLDRIVLPRYASPPWLAVFWGLAGLVLALIVLLWSAQMPVYAAGPGVIIQGPARSHARSEILLAVFLPPEYASSVFPGQTVVVHLPGWPPDEPAAVAVVEREIESPALLRLRYLLDASTGLLVEGPVFVALIRSENLSYGMVGSVGEVQVQIGTQRGLALLPGIGRFFRVNLHAPR